MKLSARYLLAALVLAAAACAAPTAPDHTVSGADASLDGSTTNTGPGTGTGTGQDSTATRGPNTFGSGN